MIIRRGFRSLPLPATLMKCYQHADEEPLLAVMEDPKKKPGYGSGICRRWLGPFEIGQVAKP
jgi:hypothetical protein